MSSIPTTSSPFKQSETPPVISPPDDEGFLVGSGLVSTEAMKITQPGGDDVVVLRAGKNTSGYTTPFEGILQVALTPFQEALAEEIRNRIAGDAAIAIRIQALEDRIFGRDFLINQAQDVFDERQVAVDANR
jgi:hypothetical protein